MSIDGVDLENLGGVFKSSLGALLLLDDVDHIGEIHLQTVLGILSVLFYDNGEDVPVSGFPHSSPTDPNCEVVATGDLDYTVAAGLGLAHLASAIDADPWVSSSYQLAIVPTVVAGPSLAAHDGANPRIDLVILTPARDPQEPEARNIKNPVTGALSVDPGVDLKNALAGTIAVVTGTPAATPAVPALPAGSLALAQAAVPAVAGAAVFSDARQTLHVGNFVKGPPGSKNYHLDHVRPNFAAAFAATVGGGLTVDLTDGAAVIGGQDRLYLAAAYTMATADAVDPRIDLIVANRDGTVTVVTGTPAASPVVPAVPTQAIGLVQVAVAALQITLLAGDLTDLRFSSWMDGMAGVRRGTLPHQALAVEPWVIVQTGGITSPNADTKQATFEIRYPDGDPWDGTFPLDVIVQCYTSSDTIGAFAAGIFLPSSGTFAFFPSGGAAPEMGEGLPTDMILFPFTGIENNGPSVSINGDAGMENGRMRGSVTAQEFKLEIGRDTGTTPAASVLMAVYPAGAPGDAAPTAHAAFTTITFV